MVQKDQEGMPLSEEEEEPGGATDMEHGTEGPGRNATVRGRRRTWRSVRGEEPGGDDIE